MLYDSECWVIKAQQIHIISCCRGDENVKMDVRSYKKIILRNDLIR